MKNISILILCAGFGKRMLDLTVDIPKPLLKVKNQIMLGNTINFFQELGYNQIFINTHYKHNQILNYINDEFNQSSIKVIYEPTILGTGGAIKNIYKYTENNKICVVNSDIFWQKNNKSDVINFIKDYKNVTHCKLLLAKNNNFEGLKKEKGDFNMHNEKVLNWTKKDEIFFYSGLQIVSKEIFENTKDIFSMNYVWNNLIKTNNLIGSVSKSKILHIGDKKTFEEF